MFLYSQDGTDNLPTILKTIKLIYFSTTLFKGRGKTNVAAKVLYIYQGKKGGKKNSNKI